MNERWRCFTENIESLRMLRRTNWHNTSESLQKETKDRFVGENRVPENYCCTCATRHFLVLQHFILALHLNQAENEKRCVVETYRRFKFKCADYKKKFPLYQLTNQSNMREARDLLHSTSLYRERNVCLH